MRLLERVGKHLHMSIEGILYGCAGGRNYYKVTSMGIFV